MKPWILVLANLALLLTSCGSSQAALDATTTQVAGELYGTQTAQAPTSTTTDTPTATATFTLTPTASLTPTITSTPLPPTPTLTAEGVEKLVICFKAAVIIQADWKVYDIVVPGYSYSDQKFQDLNAFLGERKNRIKVIESTTPLVPDIIQVDGVKLQNSRFGRDDCEVHFDSLLVANSTLRRGPWGVGASNAISHAKNKISSAVRYFRKALVEVYGMDPAELEAIEAPIWDYVASRYGVEDPIP
jgi:hypothetical protein